MSPIGHASSSPWHEEPQYGAAAGPRLGPRLGTMDGKYAGGPVDRQMYWQPQDPYMQPGCYMGELMPQSPLQFQPAVAPILSTSPKTSGAVEPQPRRGNATRRALLDQRAAGPTLQDGVRQPVPPGYVMPQMAAGGTGATASTPFARGSIQDFCAPSAALGLLEAESRVNLSPHAAEGPARGHQPAGDKSRRDDLPNPLLVRNTFLDARPQRSPSLEPFFQERQVKSSPPSRPQSGRLEVAVPRAMPSTPGRHNGSPICSLFDALITPEGVEGGHPLGQLRQAPPLPGRPLPTLNLVDVVSDCPATPERSYRDSWQPSATLSVTPLVGTGCTGSSSAGSAECAASLVSAGASTMTPGGAERLGPALGSAELPSRGSALHQFGACKPCAFVFQEGCNNATECQFCHLCEPGERKRRKKERLAMRREVREEARRRRQEPAQPRRAGALA